MTNHVLDTTRLLCPMPVIKTQNAISNLNDGDTLTVYCSDPGALHDIPAWCAVHGHKITHTEHIDDKITITVAVLKSSTPSQSDN